MYYSVTFENSEGEKKNTWEDWGLISSPPPMVNPPEVYTNFVDIPGREEGPLDLSEVLSDGPTYHSSKGSWGFIIGKEDVSRVELFREIRKFVHGKRLKVQLEEDPDYYWNGRFSVSEQTVGKVRSSITINYVIDPTEHKIQIPNFIPAD